MVVQGERTCIIDPADRQIKLNKRPCYDANVTVNGLPHWVHNWRVAAARRNGLAARCGLGVAGEIAQQSKGPGSYSLIC